MISRWKATTRIPRSARRSRCEPAMPALRFTFGALLIVAACFARVYHSPYHARTAQVTLLEVYP